MSGVAGDRSEPRLESFWIVVLGLEVDPQNRTPVALGPLGQQRGLTESRRRDDRDDRAVGGTAETVEESGANDGLSGRRRYDSGSRRPIARESQRLRDGHRTSLQLLLRPAKGACRSRGRRRASRPCDPGTRRGGTPRASERPSSPAHETAIVLALRSSNSASLIAPSVRSSFSRANSPAVEVG